MRLRTLPRYAAPWRSRREQALALTATTSVLLGLLAVAAPRAAAPADVVDVAFEAEGRPSGLLQASRSRDLPRDEDLTGGDPIPNCGTDVLTAHGNGQLPATALCPLPDHDGHTLRPDAARALVLLGRAYEQWFGEPLCMTDSYRSLESQHALAAAKPGLAARPGTSEHGWGLAADFGCGIEGYDTPEHRWMIANSEQFGWGQPDWAKDGGAREEPWHWEYLAGAAG